MTHPMPANPERSATFLIRPATAADQPTITSMVRGAGINPLSLHWPRFLVAEAEGQIVGVAQVKPHGDGTRELASLAVVPDRQGEGIGSALIGAWLAREQSTLYLMCRDELEGYYERFGFRKLDRAELPQFFRRLMPAAAVFSRIAALFGEHRYPIVMRRDGDAAAPGSTA